MDVARDLDIVEVRLERLDGVEGVLVTDARRSSGVIAANVAHGLPRARFTVAHELGHFLLERHGQTSDSGFACRSADLREHRRATRHQRQEREANLFAIATLAPANLAMPFLRSDPDLRRVSDLASALEISREAAARRYVELHDQPLAAVWSLDGVVRSAMRGDGFPFVNRSKGERLAPATQAARVVAKGAHGVTRMAETIPTAWCGDSDFGLFEQTRVGRDGHALTLLWADMPESDEDDGDVEELGAPTFRKSRQRR